MMSILVKNRLFDMAKIPFFLIWEYSNVYVFSIAVCVLMICVLMTIHL